MKRSLVLHFKMGVQMANQDQEKERNSFEKFHAKFVVMLPMIIFIMEPNVAILVGLFFDAASQVSLSTVVEFKVQT